MAHRAFPPSGGQAFRPASSPSADSIRTGNEYLTSLLGVLPLVLNEPAQDLAGRPVLIRVVGEVGRAEHRRTLVFVKTTETRDGTPTFDIEKLQYRQLIVGSPLFGQPIRLEESRDVELLGVPYVAQEYAEREIAGMTPPVENLRGKVPNETQEVQSRILHQSQAVLDLVGRKGFTFGLEERSRVSRVKGARAADLLPHLEMDIVLFKNVLAVSPKPGSILRYRALESLNHFGAAGCPRPAPGKVQDVAHPVSGLSLEKCVERLPGHCDSV